MPVAGSRPAVTYAEQRLPAYRVGRSRGDLTLTLPERGAEQTPTGRHPAYRDRPASEA
ncbi:MAG: hypothetical protein IPN45_09745 [Actinomycetales bacterium]|nr:hypothetical protein [Actinomycetales bacterium]